VKRLRLPKGIVYETKAYSCRYVVEGTRPVLYVTRADGDWCFLCGEEHPQDAYWFLVVGLGHEVDKDRTLLEILDLAPEEEAEREEVGGVWTRGRVHGL
jgi:hypothetical protein